MPISTEKQRKLDAMRVLIRAGYSDQEIHQEIGDRYDISNHSLRAQRRRLHMSNPVPERPDLQDGSVGHRFGARCPKCGGLVVPGGARFGVYAADIQTCFNCGLTNESASYFDASNGVRVEL